MRADRPSSRETKKGTTGVDCPENITNGNEKDKTKLGHLKCPSYDPSGNVSTFYTHTARYLKKQTICIAPFPADFFIGRSSSMGVQYRQKKTRGQKKSAVFHCFARDEKKKFKCF